MELEQIVHQNKENDITAGSRSEPLSMRNEGGEVKKCGGGAIRRKKSKEIGVTAARRSNPLATTNKRRVQGVRRSKRHTKVKRSVSQWGVGANG